MTLNNLQKKSEKNSNFSIMILKLP